MRYPLSILVFGTLFLSGQIAEAMDCPADYSDARSSFLSGLEELNYVIIMRHADKGKGGQLTETGERQALAMRGAFGKGRIPAQNVIANSADRTCATARMAFDRGKDICRNILKDEQGNDAPLKELAFREPSGTVIVTHSGHIRAWFGWSLACGEAAIIRRDEDGDATCLHRVMPHEWIGGQLADDLVWQHCSCAKDALDERNITTNVKCSIG